MKRLIKNSNLLIEKKITHDISTRDMAITYKNGKFFEGWMHDDCDEEMKKDPVYYEEDKELAFANLVNEAYDGTGNKKCIYIMTQKYGIVGDILEIAQKFKKKYPDYKIYDDDSGKINPNTKKIEYKRLARKQEKK